MARQMPKQGFYVLKQPNIWHEVIYTTGIRGKGNHRYWRSDHARGAPPPPDVSDWNTLLWTCVPGQKRLEDEYIYYSELSDVLVAY